MVYITSAAVGPCVLILSHPKPAVEQQQQNAARGKLAETFISFQQAETGRFGGESFWSRVHTRNRHDQSASEYKALFDAREIMRQLSFSISTFRGANKKGNLLDLKTELPQVLA